MGAAQHEYLDFPPLLVEGHRAGHRPGRQGRFEVFEFFKIGLGLLEICLKTRLLLGVAGLLDVVFELLDFLWKSRELLFDVRRPPTPASRSVKLSFVRSETMISRLVEASA